MSPKILVVDDEQDLELLLSERFDRQIRAGTFRFCFASNGQEALERLQQDPDIGVVLSDIHMPVMDGLTLLARINELNRVLKAVIVSAYGDIHNIRTAMNRGAFDFLTKPIDFHDFEVTVLKSLEQVNAARQALKTHERLASLEQELALASSVQQSILPREFPRRREFDLHAAMIPAREVGGDFYDFFPLGQDHLGFVIADVSGKGVPAALFMAVSRTVLQSAALGGLPAGECLTHVNKALASRNPAFMFVTVFYGILHAGTGEIDFAVAGHNPPYLLKPGGEVRPLEFAAGTPLGAWLPARYSSHVMRLAPGETLFLYTDGVTEATDHGENLFLEQRLEETLRARTAWPAGELIGSVLDEVHRFSSGAPQSDDITMMAIRYLGRLNA